MKGGGEHPLTVVVRIRPLNNTERLSGATEIAHTVEDRMVVLQDPTEDPDDVLRANRSREKRYIFDHALDALSSQEEVYEKTTRPLIENVMSGYNGTVFAYGATGAGKTHTMLGTDLDPGIYALALNDLFQSVARSVDHVYSVTMSYLEIYNEMIRDLLAPLSGYLEMREDAKGGVQVVALTEVSTASTGEIISLLQRGNRERTQEPTKANKTSSRSHAVLQITVKQRTRERSVVNQVRIGKLFLVDLAGSERAANTQNRGKRMVEGAHINRSLLALGNCITALSENKGPRYVNYRDSKLTRLLKDALGGNCKTVMIAHVGPSSFQFEESRNTLLYADRAKTIKNKVRRNVEDVKYHIAQYTAIIGELKEEISRLRSKLLVTTAPGAQAAMGGQAGHHGAPNNKIQAIQYEVLHGGQYGGAGGSQEEFLKLKEQLMLVFRDQMEQRKNLMTLNNRSAELSIELTRNQQLISEWEEGEGDKEKEKQLEYEGASLHSSSSIEPDEVVSARHELGILQVEMKKTDADISNTGKQLHTTKQKASQLEENLPKFISTTEQKQILELLLRTHELEIQNTELHSQIYIRDFDLSQKEETLTKYAAHKNVADDIIRMQQEILTEHSYPLPQVLVELYEEYTQEPIDASIPNFTKSFSITEGSLPPSTSGFDPAMMDRLSTLAEESQSRFSSSNPRNQRQFMGMRRSPAYFREPYNSSPALSPYHGVSHQDDSNKVFSRTPRSQHMQNAMTLPRLTVSPGTASGTGGMGLLQRGVKEDTIHTISIRSNSYDFLEQRGGAGAIPGTPATEAIAETRGIAALAAKKRKQIALETVNPPVSRLSLVNVTDPNLNKTFVSMAGGRGDLGEEGDSAFVGGAGGGGAHLLTPSRLAKHTQSYMGGPNGAVLRGEDGAESTGTRGTDGTGVRGRGGRNRGGPSRLPQRNFEKSSLSVKVRARDTRLPMTTKGAGPAGRRPNHVQKLNSSSTALAAPRYLDPTRASRNSLLTSTASLQSTGSKKAYKGSRQDVKKSRHPTIPQYKRGDFTVTGLKLE